MSALLSSISSREFCTSKHLKGPGASLERRFLSSKYTILLCQNFRNGPGHSAVAVSKPVFINSSSPVTTTRRRVLARARVRVRAIASLRRRTNFPRDADDIAFMAVVAKFPLEIRSPAANYHRP